ncbi:hypothetical protein GCM10017559_08000 [Streptosporangium longisporum]|uniref:Holliday junction nuclease RuvC n=1 Tax=Streptosporangium longisporum TaxID=46187 RepID=A0ABN3XRI7_9ACTN
MTTTATTPRVLGLDLSITATGVAYSINPDSVGTATIRPRTRGDERLVEIRNALASDIAAADLVVIEDLPTHAHGAGITGMVQGAIRVACYDHATPFVTIPPATLKKYATGRGNATKADMRMALFQRTGQDLRDDNQVDAVWLRAAGLEGLGHPVVDLPQAQRAALAKVTWPQAVASC